MRFSDWPDKKEAVPRWPLGDFDWLSRERGFLPSRDRTLAKMATMEGPLSKWTNVMKGWQYRWFVLDENSGLLSYYTVGSMISPSLASICHRIV